MKDGLAEVADLDARDPLAPFRDEFRLRDGLIYVDGNSLGCSVGPGPPTISPTSLRAAERAIETIGQRTVVSGGQI